MKLHVTDRDGAVHDLEPKGGEVLMTVIRDRVDNAVGVCGGAISCGTCLVLLDAEGQARTGEPAADEVEMLEALDAPKGARLGCQITLGPEHDGLALTVAPEA